MPSFHKWPTAYSRRYRNTRRCTMKGSKDSTSVTPMHLKECMAHLATKLQGKWQKQYAAVLVRAEPWRSHRCTLFWKTATTAKERSFIQLAVRVNRKIATQSALLPTPTASEGARGSDRKLTVVGGKVSNVSQKGVRYGIRLCQLAQVGLLPTPLSRTWRGNCSQDRGRANLEDSIAAITRPTAPSSRISVKFIAEMMGFPPTWSLEPFCAIQE